MKVMIVDDSRLARLELSEQLKQYPDLEIVAEAENVQQALQQLNHVQVDLLLLDINLPDGDGFDILLQTQQLPQVIFVTAYDEYAIKSFEFNALDYLLKPVRPERLQQALAKLKQLDQPNTLLNNESRIFIKDGEHCYFVAVQDIIACEAMGNYTRLHLAERTPAVYRPIGAIAERLAQSQFFRASRSWLINTHYIEHIELSISGGFSVQLKNQLEVEISKRQAVEFRRHWRL